jgi:hypothetical protein
MAGQCRIAEFPQPSAAVVDGGEASVMAFDSNVVEGRAFVSFEQSGVTEEERDSGYGVAALYLSRPQLLELAELLVAKANDLAKPDRFGVKPEHKVLSVSARNELYAVGMNDGINSERRSLSRQYGEQLQELLLTINTER